MAEKRCSIVTVNWNGGDSLRKLYRSLEKFEDISQFQIILSDNGSTDGSLEMVRAEFPYVEIIENRANIGFGAGNNRALEKVEGRLVLFANPDMEFVENGLEKLINSMEADDALAACGCKIYNPDGSFMKQCRRGYPDTLTSFYYASGLASLFPSHPKLAKYFYSNRSIDEAMDVDALSGSFFMAKTEEFRKVGGFDETFFLFVEEVDLFQRMRLEGKRVRYIPEMRVVHHGGVCFSKQNNRKGFYHYHMTRSHVILFAKERIRLGGGAGYHIAFILILARYLLLSLINGNSMAFRHLQEFVDLHSGRFEKLENA